MARANQAARAREILRSCQVEHVFGVVKRLFGYRKTRYKGLRKQTAKLHMLFALANLYLTDKYVREKGYYPDRMRSLLSIFG